MTRVVLLLIVLFIPLPALAQTDDPLEWQAQPTDPQEGDTIGSAEVSGFDLGRLSPGLQEEIAKLKGAALDRSRLSELAARIEAEQPRHVAAVRVVRTPDNEVRVSFVVAQMRGERKTNINDSYLIERVDIVGVPETDLSAELRAELQTLVGKPLGSADVAQLETKLHGALADYEVTRRVVRASRAGEVQLLFAFNKRESARWLHFQPMPASLVYHSDQGWGALFGLPMSGRDFQVVPIVAIDTDDDAIEEYSGFGVRVESRKLGTERLGASLEYTAFDQDWRNETLAAIDLNPRIPGAYDDRSTVTPLIRFAVTPQLSVAGGFSITELEPLSGIPESQMANAAIFSVGFEEEWRQGSATHELNTTFGIRAASETFESDFDYTRYLARGEYLYDWSKHSVLVWGMAGGIGGSAPLFERFTLGDSRTLRGWNKYDIAPAGGDRVVYGSMEYRYRGFAFFLDTGSVWDDGTDARVRVATGFGYHPGPFFMTVGFPLNTDDVRAVFATGVRFGGLGFRKD